MQFLFEHIGPVLLMLAAVGWYVSVLLATLAMGGSRATAGGRAKAAWYCTVPVVLLGVAAGKYEVAVGMIFATSVACLTLVLGIVTFAAGPTPPQPSRRMWGMLLPIALICMLIGLSGGFDWKDALILLLQGVAILWMWQESFAAAGAQRQDSIPLSRAALLCFVAIGGVLAAFFGLVASGLMSQRMGLMNGGLVTALMLAPAIALPLIGLGLQAVQDRQYDQFVGGLVGYVFLNLCILLPIATLLWGLQAPRRAEVFNMDPTTAPATRSATTSSRDDDSEPAASVSRALPYPMAVWRVDTVLLVAIGLLLLPVSLGKWSLGRVEAIGLILTWAVFMLLTAITTFRR